MSAGADRVALVDRGPAAADEVRALISPRKEAVIRKLLELAEAGDPRSIELVLKYLAPPAKPDAERITVPGLREAPTIVEKSEAIIAAVSRGDISVEAGERVQRMLELHTRAVTVQDLADEIEALKRGRASHPRLPKSPAPRLAAPDFSDLA
jgi:hypothetical protein